MKVLLKKFYNKIVKLSFDFIYKKIEISEKKFQKKNILIKKIKLNKFSNKVFKIFEVSDSRIYSDRSQNVAIIKDKFLLDKISIQINKNCLVDIKKNSILKTGTRNLIQKKYHGNILSLIQGASATNNYGHWMLDIVPKLCIAELYKDLSKFEKVYLPNNELGFQRDSLRYFNLKNNQIITEKNIRHLFAKKITIIQHPYWEKNKHQGQTASIDSDMIKILRKKFLNFKVSNKSKKIFIDRSDSKFYHSQIENYDEVIKILKSLNFKIIKLSNLSFKKQLKLFVEAKTIVGAHGAGLCNSIFSSPGTKLIELRSKNFNAELLKNISEINQLQYIRIISKKPLPKNRMRPDIFVPIEKLIKSVNS